MQLNITVQKLFYNHGVFSHSDTRHDVLAGVFVCWSIFVSVCVSVSLSVNMSVYLCLSICVCMCVCVFIGYSKDFN